MAATLNGVMHLIGPGGMLVVLAVLCVVGFVIYMKNK